MRVIGAGGDAFVYIDKEEPKTVVKAIFKNNNACTKAAIEYEKQRSVYDCIGCLTKCGSDDPLVSLVAQYVRVAEPIGFEDSARVIGDTRYDCALKMSKLNGLPLRLYTEFDERITQRIDASYREELGDVMAHLAFNSPVVGIFGVKYSTAQITRENPPRGYFSNAETGFFQFLREKHGLRLSDEELERMIGFLYGWIYSACGIIPLDVEFALGLNPESGLFELNVLDFGMAFDTRAIEKNTNAFETRRFMGVFGGTELAQSAQKEELLQRVIEDTGLDLYASLEEDSESYKGFMMAMNIGSCNECKRLTFYVHKVSSLFLCSSEGHTGYS